MPNDFLVHSIAGIPAATSSSFGDTGNHLQLYFYILVMAGFQPARLIDAACKPSHKRHPLRASFHEVPVLTAQQLSLAGLKKQASVFLPRHA